MRLRPVGVTKGRMRLADLSFSVVARAAATAHLRATFTCGRSSNRDRGRNVGVGFGVADGDGVLLLEVGEDEVSLTGSSALESSPPPQAARLLRSAALRKAAARRREPAGVRVRDVVTAEFFPP